MGKILVLPDELCNQIAAGEVVERPAAVVKELVENSIDAGCRKVAVAIEQGGRKEIRVVDDGCGMSGEDALLAIERHATSKIGSLDDLQAIRTMGFRGEALPSIAAVSRFELVSREPEAISGTMVRVEGGIVREVRETGCPPGTMITVRDLFYNIPVRRKFLRSPDTELAHAMDLFLRLGLIHWAVHFQLGHGSRTLYEFPAARSLEERAGQIFGPDTSKAMAPFSLDEPYLKITGLTTGPEIQRASARFLYTFVNGRPIWDRLLNRSILGAYATQLPGGKYPLTIAALELPFAAVDVNVHPTKREVRFRNPGEIARKLEDTMRTALETSPGSGRVFGLARLTGQGPTSGAKSPTTSREDQLGLDPTRSAQPLPGSPLQSPVDAYRDTAAPSPSPPSVQLRVSDPFESGPPPFPGPASADAIVPGPESAAAPRIRFARLPVLGQLGRSYILLEADDGLVVIDQHAAHERILYDRLASEVPAASGGQRLLRSVILDLPPKEAALLRRRIEAFQQVGYEIEPFGGNTFLIHTVPVLLHDYPADRLIREVLEAAHDDAGQVRIEVLADLAKTAACHKAVRAGERLRAEEIATLLDGLDRTRNPATCPHGRPVWFKLSYADIERLFGRC